MTDTTPRYISTADGKRLRCQVFDAAPGTASRGVCVLLHGQTEFIEKYVEVIGELRLRGFTVATFDWPGQGGSYRFLAEPLKAHVWNFAEYDSALRLFMKEAVNPLSDKPPVALAHSMGGHILLRALHDQPNTFKCAVLSAPMLRTLTRGYPRALARAACWFEYQIGAECEWVWGMDERDPHKVTFDTQLVTSDRERFGRTQAFLRIHPDLRLAGPTWGWLEQAYRSMALMDRRGYPEAISTPVMICAPGRDRIVDVAAEYEFVKRLPKGEIHPMPESEHEILMENDLVRADFWQTFDKFVGKFV